MNGIMKGINGEEILTCLILVAIGYFIAKMFSRMCSCKNGLTINLPEITAKNLCKENASGYNPADEQQMACGPSDFNQKFNTCDYFGRAPAGTPDLLPDNQSLSDFCRNWNQHDEGTIGQLYGQGQPQCLPRQDWKEGGYELTCNEEEDEFV